MQPRNYTGSALATKATEIPTREYEFMFEGKKFKGVKSSNVKDKTEEIAPYLPGKDLLEAVEIMQILRRPLLLRGEPGCGKTKVAQAVAYEWYKDEPEGYGRYYFEWHIKSSSKAQDGLYKFDHIARLRDANLPKPDGAHGENIEDLVKYRSLGPLGKAFLASEPGKPAILLIDEIDKADIDFPNDLLLELDEMRFKIPETNEEIIPVERPLIFITSNREREMPEAFLRRCIFHFIKFPDEIQLIKILESNFPTLNTAIDERGDNLISRAVQRFIEMRDEIERSPAPKKNISTSELKDWVQLLDHYFHKGKPELKEFNSILKKNEIDYLPK